MTLLTVSTKGWVVIPSELREKYQLQAGTQVHVVDYGGILAIVPVIDKPITHARGMLKGKSSLTKALLAERARSKRKEGRSAR